MALRLILIMHIASSIFNASTIHPLLTVIKTVEREDKGLLEKIIPNTELLSRLKEYDNQDVNSFNQSERDAMKSLMDLVKMTVFSSLKTIFNEHSSETTMEYIDRCSLKTSFSSVMKNSLSNYISSAHKDNRCLYGLHGFLNETLVEIERQLKIAEYSGQLNQAVDLKSVFKSSDDDYSVSTLNKPGL